MFFSFIAPELKYDIDAEKQLRKLKISVAAVHKELLNDVATFWHHRLLPGHFTPGNEDRYDMEPRSPGYLKTKRRYGVGQGKYVANVFTGMSFRWLMTLFNVSGTSTQATVTMKAPTYFTNPATGTFTGKNGRTFTISHQPDKAKEVTQVNDSDRSQMQKYMGQRYQELLDRYLGQAAAKAA